MLIFCTIPKEASLRSRGEELPAWVSAYRDGDSVKAAKLLHLSYTAGGRRGVQRGEVRHVVQEATSTTPTIRQETSSSSSQEVVAEMDTESNNSESIKRTRLNSE